MGLLEQPVRATTRAEDAGLLRRIKRGVRRMMRAMLSWASLLAIPCGLVVGYNGHRTLGALLILGGTLAYFLVDPILMILDLLRFDRPESDRGASRR